MIKTVFSLLLLFAVTGCSIIHSIEQVSNSLDSTNYVNSSDYSGYIKDIEKPENSISILQLSEKRKSAVYKSIAALRTQNHITENISNSKEKLVIRKNDDIENAHAAVKKYLISAADYNCEKEKISAEKALTCLEQSQNYQSLGKYTDVESEIKLAILYLVNDKTTLWQYQKTGEHKFPTYLKWGDTTPNSFNNITSNPDSLVFSGGGAKGISYAGVLKYFQETNKLKNVQRFIGTSAGSIMCTFMSIASYYEQNRKPGSKHAWEIV
jgi:hypothetical protein